MLNLDHTVQCVVERLADHGAVDTFIVTDLAYLRDAPAAHVGNAEIAQFTRPDQVTQRTHRLSQGRGLIVTMQIHDVDRPDTQTAQAGLDRVLDMQARRAALVRAGAGRGGQLGRQYPPIA